MRPVPIACLVVTLALAAPAAGADVAAALRTAMAPYYAALVASARGDAESTARNLALFEARWRAIAARSADPPDALASSPEWPPMVSTIDGCIARAHERLRARDVHAAHLEIEGIRLALYRGGRRLGLDTLDDKLTEYHESMERIATRASMYNEIILNDADYAEMARDLGRANALWPSVDLRAGDIADTRAWRDAARRSAIARDELARLIAAREDAAIARAARDMKDAYLELLSVLARVER